MSFCTLTYRVFRGEVIIDDNIWWLLHRLPNGGPPNRNTVWENDDHNSRIPPHQERSGGSLKDDNLPIPLPPRNVIKHEVTDTDDTSSLNSRPREYYEMIEMILMYAFPSPSSL